MSGMSGLSGRAGRVDILISLSEAIFLLTMLVLRAHRRPMAAGAAGAGKRETDAVHSFAAFSAGLHLFVSNMSVIRAGRGYP